MKLKPYPKYKESGVQWIGKIPENWEINKVKHICSKSAEYGLNEPSDNYVDEGVRFLRTTDITENERLIENGVYLPENKTNKECLLDTGDVLVARSGSVGTSLYFDKRKYGKCSFAGYLVRFVVNKLNNGRFLYYFTKSKSFYAQIESQSIQTTIENFNGQKYANMQISVPPLQDQTQIANFLDAQISEINSIIEKDKKLIELLKEKRTALINHVVTKGLNPKAKMKDSGIEWIGEVPEGWEVRKIKLIGNIVLGKMLTPETEKEGDLKPYMRAENIQWEKISLDDVKEMRFTRGEMNKFKLKANDLLVSEGGEVGRTAIWNNELGECYIQNSINKISFTLESVSRYFMYLFETYGSLKYFEAIVNRVSIAHLTREKLKEVYCLVPPKSEQLQIVSYLDKATSKIDQTIKKIEEKITLMEEYKKSLIHHVVTGKVDVREAVV